LRGLLFLGGYMKSKRRWGDISIIGITESGKISIEFFNPDSCDDSGYTTIFLDSEHIERISKLGEIIRGKAS
jgi:hypothetical protein